MQGESRSRGYALLPQSGGFESFGSVLEEPKPSNLPALDVEHQHAPRAHLDPLAPRTWAVSENTTSDIAHAVFRVWADRRYRLRFLCSASARCLAVAVGFGFSFGCFAA